MGTSVFTGRGQGSSAGGVLTASSVWVHADIIAGGTQKIIVPAVAGQVIIPVAFSVQRASSVSSTYGTNASFNLHYNGVTGVTLGSLTPQLLSLTNKYYAYLNTLNGAYNNTLTPANTAIIILSVNNTGGVGGTTILTFSVNYVLIPSAM